MYTTSSNRRVSYFRNNVFVWMLLAVLSCSFVPSISLAQQPTATISAVSGTVLVNGQDQGKGTLLRAGDVIETQAGATVVLELSDGSLLDLGEKTKVDIADLSQTVTGARVSRVKLAWGWIRAQLSPDHQQAGSVFDIETPNALVGVQFSQPDVEVSYDPARLETVALARTVTLLARNLLTQEEVIVPVGSTVIITTTTIKIIAGIISIEQAAAEAAKAEAVGAETAAGMSTATKVALGAGVIAAAGGGVAAIAAGGDGDGSDGDGTGDGNGDGTGDGSNALFTGTFVREFTLDINDWAYTDTFTFSQNGSSLTGTLSRSASYYYSWCGECISSCTVSVTGTVEGSSGTLSHGACVANVCCDAWTVITKAEYPGRFTLVNNNQILRFEGGEEFIRQ